MTIDSDTTTLNGESGSEVEDNTETTDAAPNADELSRQLEDLQSKVSQAEEEKNRTAKLARKLKERVEELEAAQDAHLSKKAESGDSEALQERLQNAIAKAEELKSERDELQTKFRTTTLKEQAWEVAKKHVREDAKNTWWLEFGNALDLNDDGAAVVRNNDVKSLDEFVKETLADRPFFRRSEKVTGSGVEKSAGDAADHQKLPTLQELAAMPDGGKSWINKNREAAAKLLGG